MSSPAHQHLNSGLKDVLNQCRSSFYALGFFSLVINLLMLLPSLYMLQVYDRVLTTKNYNTLWMLSLIVFLLLVVMGMLEWIRKKILVRVSSRFDHLMRERVYDACFRQALFSGNPVRSSRALKGLGELRQFISPNSIFAFFDAPWSPLYIAIMFLFHPSLGLIAVAGAVSILSMAVLQEKMTQKTMLDAHQAGNQAEASCTSQYQNAEVIEALGMKPQVRKKWERFHLKMLSSQNQASYLISALSAAAKSFRIILQSMVLGAGAYLAITQEITPGMMVAASILLGRALAPVDQLVGAWRSFVSARVQFNQLNFLLNSIPTTKAPIKLPDLEGDVLVENLVVHTPGTKTVAIKGISFGIRKGDSVAIIGPSGSGKSSLLRAVLGIWPAVSGTVRLDGSDIRTWDRQQLGPRIGYMPQDVELFDGSIAENIARFSEMDDEQVITAAKMAGVHQMILQLSEGYNTRIGTSGRSLSGGQRQRIGLARALYKAPRLIILDEPNANLDEQGEHALNDALEQVKALGSTLVIVSHRPAILSQVNKVMSLQNGHIKLFGPRDQVMQKLASPRAHNPMRSSQILAEKQTA